MLPKSTENGASPASDVRESRDYSSRIAGAVSNSILSIGDLIKDVGRDGPKSVKFPEKLLKVLEQKLQGVIMKKEPRCVLEALRYLYRSNISADIAIRTTYFVAPLPNSITPTLLMCLSDK